MNSDLTVWVFYGDEGILVKGFTCCIHIAYRESYSYSIFSFFYFHIVVDIIISCSVLKKTGDGLYISCLCWRTLFTTVQNLACVETCNQTSANEIKRIPPIYATDLIPDLHWHFTLTRLGTKLTCTHWCAYRGMHAYTFTRIFNYQHISIYTHVHVITFVYTHVLIIHKKNVHTYINLAYRPLLFNYSLSFSKAFINHYG